MEKHYNGKTAQQFKWLKEEALKYSDALVNIFGKYYLDIAQFGDIFLCSELGTIYLLSSHSMKDNLLCFSYKDEYKYNSFNFYPIENGIAVNEIIIHLHKKGANVEIVERIYGKSKYDKNKNALLDLQSTNYVISNYSSIGELRDIEFLQKNSMLTTTFSAHMKHFYRVDGEVRNFVSTKYPSHVFFNGEDISHVYEFVDGIDKISRIYNLYIGNVKKESDDVMAICTGLVDESSFNYKSKSIANQVQELIGELRDDDVQDQMIEEYIEQQLGKSKPIVIGLRDATRVEIGITPTQSRKRLDDKIDDIIDTKSSSKVKRFIRKLVPPKK